MRASTRRTHIHLVSAWSCSLLWLLEMQQDFYAAVGIFHTVRYKCLFAMLFNTRHQ